MKEFKKAIAVLLTVAMLLSVTSVSLTAYATSEWDNIEFTPLVVDSELTVSLLEEGEVEYFSFTPDVSGFYTFSSNGGNCQNVVDLYQAVENEEPIHLGRDSLNYADGHFSLGYSLAAGETYYYAVKMYYENQTGEFTVVLNDYTIESISFEPISIVENTSGYESNTSNGDIFYHYNWYSYLKYDITMNDGQKIEGTGQGFTYNDQWHRFDFQDDQNSNPWTVGNTYTVTVTVMGCETEIDVTITPSPIESIVFEPISIIENSGGYESNTPDGDSYYRYAWQNQLKYTITMNDGQKIEGTGPGFTYNDQLYNFNYQDNQYSNHWTVGNTYTVTVNAMGCVSEVDVTITPSPIESISFEPISIVENSGGYKSNTPDGGSYYIYEWQHHLKYTVIMNDGQTIEGTGSGFTYNGQWINFNYQDNQYSNHWTVGNTYTVTVGTMGCETEVDVTITSSPIKSIEFKPITLVENTGGYYSDTPDGDSFYYYWWNHLLEYTITTTDDEVIEGKGNSFMYNGQTYNFSYYDDQYSNPWIGGNTYNINISALGCETEVQVSICEKNEVDGFEYLLQDGCAIIVGCNKYDPILEIPSTVDGYTVVGITDITGAIYYAKELVIPDTVTMISDNVFMGGSELEKITLGKGMENLTNEMFSNCYNLKEIIVSPENPEYTSVDGVVYDKDVTTIIVFPNGKKGTYTVPDTVTDISIVFDNLNSYDIKLDLGNSKTGYVEVDGVYYDENMTTVYLCSPDKTGTYTMPDTVTTINESAFKNTNLSEIIVSENVSDIVYSAFSYSIELEKVVLPQNLKSISGYAFYGCENLTEADLPSGLTELEEFAFAGSGIKKANIPSGVECVGRSAYANSKLSELTLAEGIKAIFSAAFASTNIKNIVLPDSLTHLGESAFTSTPLETLKIGSGLEGISAGAFANTSLTTVTIPENIAEIGEYAFANSLLEEAIIEYNAVYIFEGAFYNCPLKEVELKEGTVCIEDYAFYGNNATSLILPQSVTDITYKSFAESKKLLTIDVSDNLESLCGTAFDGTAWWFAQDDGVVYLEDYLYGYKGKMPEGTEITVKDGTPIIASYAFDEETNLKKISIPASVKNIGYGAFNSCFNLEKVSVDSLNEYYSTNDDGTILYDSYGLPVWRRIESIDYVEDLRTYFSYGEEFSASYRDDGVVWVVVNYVDGTSDWHRHAPKAEDVSGFDNTKTGYQTITMNFGKFEYEYEVYIESAGCHNYSSVVTNPTCTAEGYTTYTCLYCGDTYESDFIPALDHDYAEDFTIDKEATTSEEGSKSRHCSRCDSVTDVTVIPKISTVTGTCGENAIWTLSSDGTLVINGTGATKNYGSLGAVPWYSYSDTITTIEIGSDITHIGHYMFRSLTKLESVECANPDLTFSKYYVFGTSDMVFYGKGGSTLEEYTDANGYKLVKPENPDFVTVIAPVLLYKNAYSITLAGVEGYEYSLDGENWQKSNTFENLLPNTEYVLYQRITDDVYSASAKSDALIVATTDIPDAPSIENISDNTVTVVAVNGYEYSIDGVNWQSNNIFTNLESNKIYSILTRTVPTNTIIDPTPSKATKLIIVTAPEVQLVGESKIVVKAVDGYEYSVDGVVWQNSNVFTDLIPEFDYVVYQRYAGSDVYSYTVGNEGTQFVTNGQDGVDTNPDSSNLVILMQELLRDFTNMASDYNDDGEINLLDLVRLKKFLAGQDVPLGAQSTETQTTELLAQPAYIENRNYIL